jgi:hypothetical protein
MTSVQVRPDTHFGRDPVGLLMVGKRYVVTIEAPGIWAELRGSFQGFEEWRDEHGDSLDTGFYHFDFGIIDSELKAYSIRPEVSRPRRRIRSRRK